MEERRSAVRWPIHLEMRYKRLRTHTEGIASSLDLSLKGAKIEVMGSINPGDELDLVLEVPDKGGTRNCCVKSEVRWMAPASGFQQECKFLAGLEFMKIMDCHKESILAHIRRDYQEEVCKRWWNGLG